MRMNPSRLSCCMVLFFVIFTVCALGVHQEWSKTFGGDFGDGAWSLQRSNDGGYIIAGYTCSLGKGGDLWLVKMDENGTEQWNRSFGGSGEDVGYYVKQTMDGGYIVVGSTKSYGLGEERLWLLKVDSNGNREWDRTFGGFVSSSGDGGWSVDTAEDGYIIAGYTKSFGAGGKDLWLIKTDLQGRAQWQRTYGGLKDDVGMSVIKTHDNGYIVAGRTASFGSGGDDIWLLKVGPEGIEQWNRTFGEDKDDVAFQVIELEDGYILTGRTEIREAKRAFLLKTDFRGVKKWEKTYGQESSGISVQRTGDGGFIVAGSTETPGAGKDALLIKTDSSGKEQWIMPLGGKGDDVGTAVVESADGGYILAGITSSFEAETEDVWLTKIIADDLSENATRNATEIAAMENALINTSDITIANPKSTDIENADIENADNENADTKNVDTDNSNIESANTAITAKSMSIPRLEGHSILAPPAFFKKQK
jgi:predicted secreted protein